jgi:hypothetical protein
MSDHCRLPGRYQSTVPQGLPWKKTQGKTHLKPGGLLLTSSTSPPEDPLLADRTVGVVTNRAGAGLGSVDRNNKTTRPLTPPVQTTKSSAKDLSPHTVKLQYASWRDRFPRPLRRQPAEVQGRSLFVLDYDMRERITPFWHGF